MVSQSGSLIPGLPNEVAIFCLAKVPLLYRHRISGVCRGWRDIFREEHIWAMRRERSACETLLLLWSKNYYKTGAWHGFYPATNGWVRLPLMSMDEREKGYSTFAAVDGKLFFIGGQVSSGDRCPPAKSSKVSFFDLKRWEWKETAPMNIGRYRCMTGAMNGLLYVFGGRTDQGDTSTAEVYDPVAATWKFVSSMQFPLNLQGSIVLNGKFYAVNTVPAVALDEDWEFKGVVYSPQEDQWTQMAEELNSGWSNFPVEFNGMICISRESTDGRETSILGYDPSENTWKLIHGERAIENFFYPLRRPSWGDYRKLLSLDGRLCYIIRKTIADAVWFEIEDLTTRCVASKSFCRRVLTGSEENSHLARLELDDIVVVEREVVRM